MKRLVLITDAFPWGRGEVSFILPELPYLQKKYKLTILSRSPIRLCKEGMDKVALPEDIEVLHYPEPEDMPKTEKWGYVIPALLNRDFQSEMRTVFEKKQGLHNLKMTYFFWLKACKFRKWMRKKGLFDDLENTIFYSYWANYSVYTLTMEKRENPTLTFVSRIHRYDLYNEYFQGGRQPFKPLVDKWIDRMIFIAQEGLDYYLDNFTDNKADCGKYVLCRLGVEGQQKKPEKKEDDIFRLVSCSAVSERKRVELILQALALLDVNIEWHHFGSGPMSDEIEKMASDLLDTKDNIQYVLHGFTPNKDVIRYYQNNYADCFITTSANEGCPVSIQEALSFGIPVIGTDVGEIRYMIEKNGILLSTDPSIEEVADAIRKMYFMVEENGISMRNCSLSIWDRDYRIEKNTAQFIEVLESCRK